MRRPHRRHLPLLVVLLLAASTGVGSADSGSAPGQQAPSLVSAPAVTGTAQQGQTLSATTGSWKGVSVSYAYQWKRCDLSGNGCVSVAGATSSTYQLTGTDVGATMRAAVTASNKNGSIAAASAQTPVVAPLPAPPPAAPTNSSPPAISGTAQTGQTLSASNGSWSGSPTSYAYQWRRCDSAGASCSSVSGATTSSYLLVSGDVGSTMRVVVSATNAGGTGSATSNQTSVVAAAPTLSAPTNTALPQVTGTAQVGQTLSTSNGSWSGSPTGYGYQWKRCDSTGTTCNAISGATASTYLLASADAGSTLRATVTATNGAGTGTATSAQTGLVAAALAAPASTALPAITGTAQAAQTLSASTGSWSGSPTSYGYQWRRCDSTGTTCASVSGATFSTYGLTSADVGSTMRVVVSATNSAGTGSATSGTTASVAAAPTKPTNTALPAVTGTAQAGQTLTVSNGTWSGSPTTYGYQWKRCDSAGANCGAVAGATAKTFALTSTDVGKTLRADVTASNSAGSTLATAAQTALVAAAPTSTTDVYSKPVPRSGLSPGYTILNRTSAMQDFELSQIVSIGAKAIRLDYWEEAKADVTIGKALSRGLEVELVIGATMHYASRDTVSDFQARCSRAATKYRGKVRFYETLNEPNINGWVPSTFVQYQRACYQAIKAVDSRNVVFMGGISPTANGTNSQGTTYAPVQWVQQFYANGGKGSFDQMNVHLYGDPAVQAAWSVWCQTFGCGTLVNPSIVQVMAANGDSKPVVSTESGDNAVSVGETKQASAVGGALKDTRVQQAYVYDMLNTVSGFGVLVPDAAGTVVDPTGAHWRKRPSYGAYQTNAT